jgi:DnaJ-like protein
VREPPDEHPIARIRAADGKLQVGPSREALIERQIQEAMAEGKFDNLPHHGAPLPNDDNPYAAEWGLAYRVLKNAGFAPPWIEADKQARELLDRRDAILARAATGPAPSEIARRQDRAALEQVVAEANAAIDRVNTEAPSARQHRRRLVIADELSRYDDACRR